MQVNIGDNGFRVCFLGIGGELIYKANPDLVDKRKKFDGFGFQIGLLKAKILW